jgi:hypothetical protein
MVLVAIVVLDAARVWWRERHVRETDRTPDLTRSPVPAEEASG